MRLPFGLGHDMQAPDPAARRSAGIIPKRRKPLPWPVDKEFRILSIDGGGIRGILPAGFLASLEEAYLGDGGIGDHFDLIVGTSTGGIIALGLANGLTAGTLRDLYVDRGGEVFPDYGPFGKAVNELMGAVRHRCDHKALERLIAEVLGEKCFWQARKRVNIPSIDSTYGEVFVFKTPHHPDFKLDWCKPMALAARATSAAQSFFKPVSDGTYEYLDGGIWANNPVMIGLVDVLSCFDVPRDRISILSLGCVEDTYGIGTLQRHLGGKVFWPSNVINGGMHLQSMNAVGQAGLLIGRDKLIRVNYPPIRPKLEMNDWARCREILPGKARELMATYGDAVRSIFLQTKADEYVPCYSPDNPPPVV